MYYSLFRDCEISDIFPPQVSSEIVPPSIPASPRRQEPNSGYLRSWVSSLERRLERFKSDHTEQFQGLLQRCCTIGERVNRGIERFPVIHTRIESLKLYVKRKLREMGFTLFQVQKQVQAVQRVAAANTEHITMLERRTLTSQSELQGQVDDMQIVVDESEGKIEKVGSQYSDMKQRVEKLESKSCTCTHSQQLQLLESRVFDKIDSMETRIISRLDNLDGRLGGLERSVDALTTK